MSLVTNNLARILAGCAMIAIICVPAHAIDLGDRNKGLGVTAEIDGSSDLDVSVGATVGGRSTGIDADANASPGGDEGLVDADAAASIGGSKGTKTDAKIIVGGPGLASGGAPDGTDLPDAQGLPGPGNPDYPKVISGMSDSDLRHARITCKAVLRSASSYGSDLVSLCQLIQTASR